MNRTLYRCRENRVIAGVASGVAEFFGLDPTLVRVLWFLSLFVGGLGLVAYVGLAIIVPNEPLSPEAEAAAAAAGGHTGFTGEGHRHRSGGIGDGRVVTFIGLALMLLGALALLGELFPGVATWRYLGPAFVIGVGGLLIAGAMRRETASGVASQPAAQKELTES